MKISHRVTLNVSNTEKEEFEKAGVNVELGFTTLKIEETDERWPQVCAIAKKYNGVDIPTTSFTKKELDSSRHLSLVPSWHHGYPYSTEEKSYLSDIYDLSEYCGTCGIGKRQKRPFRIDRIPAWGKNSILQVNWIFDEFFVKPQIWEDIFKPHGIEHQCVLLGASDRIVDSVVQLDVPDIVELDMKDRECSTCTVCNRIKYLPISRGFHPDSKANDKLIAKSAQYFGSGNSAFRQIHIDASLYKQIKNADVRGVDFKACAI